MPGYEHAAMQQTVVALLQPIAKQLGGKVFSEWSIGCGESAWLTPDAMFAFPGFQRAANGHLCPPPPPHLVIEVVSPGQTGLVRKARDYKPYQVPFYWIIDPFEEACYEVLMTTPQITAVLKEDELTAGPEVKISVADLWGAYRAAL